MWFCFKESKKHLDGLSALNIGSLGTGIKEIAEDNYDAEDEDDGEEGASSLGV